MAIFVARITVVWLFKNNKKYEFITDITLERKSIEVFRNFLKKKTNSQILFKYEVNQNLGNTNSEKQNN